MEPVARSGDAIGTPLAAASVKPRKEIPLDGFLPESYIAMLEGTLLVNGDLKGSWKAKREDRVGSEFCMVLMDKGMYDGGFNIRASKGDSSRPSVEEIHDKWHSLEWCETTRRSTSNVWGRGCNSRFGGCYLIGVHNPRQRNIVMYKVGEAEMLRARDYARTASVMTQVPVQSSSSSPSVAESVSTRPKRPRTHAGTEDDFATAGALSPAASGRSEVGKSPGSTVSGGDESSESGRGQSRAARATGKDNTSTQPPHKVPKKTTGAIPVAKYLPGFSGCFEDAGSSSSSKAPNNEDELTDLTILGARLQRERRKIREDAKSQRRPFVAQKTECVERLAKGRADEAMLSRALQDLRQKMRDDERRLESANDHLKSYEAKERHALKSWNKKWETQVTPFIAQYEQGVQRRAEELEQKTREAIQQRAELERELERLRSVKKMGS